MLLVAALLALPSSGIGAPFPGATLLGAPEQRSCYFRYRASTAASIAHVANFYAAEAMRAGIALLDDTKTKFADYRTLAFIAQPKFMFVLLDRKDSRTTIVVRYKTSSTANARMLLPADAQADPPQSDGRPPAHASTS